MRAVAPKGARGASLDDLASVKKESPAAGQGAGAKDKDDKRAACKVSVKIDKAEGARDPAALRRLVERTARAIACPGQASLRLRITVDKTGKIAKVEVIAGDKKVGEAMVRKLTSATSATRAQVDKATIELTITVGS